MRTQVIALPCLRSSQVKVERKELILDSFVKGKFLELRESSMMRFRIGYQPIIAVWSNSVFYSFPYARVKS